MLDAAQAADRTLPQLDHSRALVRREWQDAQRRLRSALAIGLVIWPMTGLLDWFVAEDDPPLLHWLFGIRDVGWAVIGLGFLTVHLARQLSPLALTLIDAFEFTAACVLICAMCWRFGGIASGYSTGLLLVIMVRAATVAEHWRRGAPIYLWMGSTFPAFMFAAANFDPAIAAQFSDRAAVSRFAVQHFFILSGTLIGMLSAHAVWRLRREAYETRELGA